MALLQLPQAGQSSKRRFAQHQGSTRLNILLSGLWRLAAPPGARAPVGPALHSSDIAIVQPAGLANRCTMWCTAKWVTPYLLLAPRSKQGHRAIYSHAKAGAFSSTRGFWNFIIAKMSPVATGGDWLRLHAASDLLTVHLEACWIDFASRSGKAFVCTQQATKWRSCKCTRTDAHMPLCRSRAAQCDTHCNKAHRPEGDLIARWVLLG